MTRLSPALKELTYLYGLQSECVDMAGRVQTAEQACLRVVLQILGASVRGEENLQRAIRLRRKELASRWVEPVPWPGREGLRF